MDNEKVEIWIVLWRLYGGDREKDSISNLGEKKSRMERYASGLLINWVMTQFNKEKKPS